MNWLFKLFAGLALACLCSPAVAQDADCQPVTTLIADAPAQGYSIADDIKVKGTIFDRETVIVLNGSIFIWFSMDGCIVAKPLWATSRPHQRRRRLIPHPPRCKAVARRSTVEPR